MDAVGDGHEQRGEPDAEGEVAGQVEAGVALATLERLGPQRPGALADVEGVSPPSMTRIVASLEEGGYVERSPDPDDGRAAVVAITGAGRELVVGRKNDKLTALERRIARLDPAARAAQFAALPALEQLSQE